MKQQLQAESVQKALAEGQDFGQKKQTLDREIDALIEEIVEWTSKNKEVYAAVPRERIDNLFEKLDKEYDSKNFILNYYGRPITSNNNLVNYWIQSSAVDFCSLAFYDFFKNMLPADVGSISSNIDTKQC